MKRLLSSAILLLASVAALAQPIQQKAITAINSTPTATCSANSCVVFDMRTQGTAQVQVTGTYTASGGLSLQSTVDGVTWVTVGGSGTFRRLSTGVSTATITSGEQGVYQLSGDCVGAYACRVTALGAVTGSATVSVLTSSATAGGIANISGGAGDASAANQVAGNASLTSIDAKTPALGTQAIASSRSVTPATSSTWAATQSGAWSARLQDGSGNAVTSATRGSERALSVQIVDGTGTQVTSFGGSGGLAQGSTTSGQTGALQMGAVTTSAPTYTTGQTSPFSLDTSGNLRVAVAGGAGSNVSGTTAHDAVGTSVNPVLMGGYASAAAPTNVSADGDAVRAWMLRSGAQVVQPSLGGVLASAGSGTNGTGVQRVTIATDDTLMSTINTSLGTINTSINADPNYSGVIGAATAPTRMVVNGGVYNSTPPTLTNGQSASLQVSAAGRLQVDATTNQTVNVAQINGVTPLMGAGNTGTGSPRVTISTDQAALPTHGHGAAGSAAPSGATMAGARSGANMVPIPASTATVPISMSTATTTQHVALSGSTQTYVTSLFIVSAGTTNVTLVYGTGTNCGTGTTSLTGAIPLVANAGLSIGSGLGGVIVVPAGQALCITNSAGVQISGMLSYSQY